MKSISHHPISKRKRSQSPALFRLILVCTLFLSVFFHSTRAAYASEVSLIWDPVIHPELGGYKMFYRKQSQPYDYTNPIWVGTETTCTVDKLEDQTNYCFVVRAFDISGNESDDSNEVCWSDSPGFNMPPDEPLIISPYPGQHECELTPVITTEPFVDPDDDSHLSSRWQISELPSSSSLLLDARTIQHLTSLSVPLMVLDEYSTYYVRVQHYDSHDADSGWSEWIEFTTTATNKDLDDNGIPDEQEVDYGVDLNEDGVDDVLQPEVIKSVKSIDGTTVIGIGKASESIQAIEAVDIIDPATVMEDHNAPGDISVGLMAYRLILDQPGAVAKVTIYFSDNVSTGHRFYKYDSIRGWYDYTHYCTFGEQGKSVTVELKDGDYGDVDGVANGIIMDPSALVIENRDSGAVNSSCFIATAAFGSYMEPNVKLLRDFRDKHLLNNAPGKWFVKPYYRSGPQAADFIEVHEYLKPAVRLALMPLVGFSYMFLKGYWVLSFPFVLGLVMLAVFHLFKQHYST